LNIWGRRGDCTA